MGTAWQAETGLIECRWSPALEPRNDKPLWLQELSAMESRQGFSPPLPNFAAHSPFGSGEWFVPWSARWRVPRP